MVFTALLAVALAQAAPAAPAREQPRPAAAGRRDPYARVQQAKAAFEKGDYPRVLAIVDGLLREYPGSPSSHLLRAMALDELGRLPEAARSYEAALASSPDDPQILMRYGMHELRAERWPAAIGMLERALASGPDALGSFYLAQAYFHTDSKGKALDAVERAAVLAPRNPTILLKLGEYRAQAGKHAAALEALRQAQRINPDEPGLDLALGIVQLSLLDVEPARASLERALAKEPDNLAVLSNLATACSRARDPAAARRYYQELLDRGQHDAPYYLGLGSALLGLGEKEAAITALRTAVEKSPKVAEGHFHLARAYRAAGRLDESQRELHTFQALKASPFQPLDERVELEKSLWRRAQGLLEQGKEQDALKLLSTGNAPGNQPEYLVGALYYTLGRYADAERLLRRAVQLSPELPKLHAYLGLALLAQGRVAEAEQAIAPDVAQNPREPFVLMAVGQLHYYRKEWAEAARDLQESHVVELPVLLMLCEAQLESGGKDDARETAQLITTFAAARHEVLAALGRLLERHALQP